MKTRLTAALTVLLAAVLTEAPAQWTMELRARQKQLFLDDYVIGKVRNLRRTLHQPAKNPETAILRPEHSWENLVVQTRNAPFWDPQAGVWKLYYLAFVQSNGDTHTSCLAVSKDGVSWEKPQLGVVDWKGSTRNNLVTAVPGDGFLYHVLYDPNDVPARRFKGFFGLEKRQPAVSPDGLRWTALPVPPVPSQDESQVIYDETSRRFVATVKHEGPYGRSVYLSVSQDFEKWTAPKLIFHADGVDQERGRARIGARLTDARYAPLAINQPDQYNVDIYNMPVFPYHGIYIGMPMKFHQSGPTPIGNQDGFHHVELVTSRDLEHWTPVADRAVFIPNAPVGPGVYDTGTIVPPTRPVVRDGELWFYYTGIKRRFQPDNVKVGSDGKQRYVSVPDGGAIYLSRLRLDGFVSLDAGQLEGSLTTLPVKLGGKRLFVNADARAGEVRAEILDARGRTVLDAFSLDKSVPVRGDQLEGELRWKGAPASSLPTSDPVRIRFVLKNASLYAFWVAE
jgi:hypothetical protein